MEDLVPICSPHKQPTDSCPLLQLRKGPTFYQWNTETTQSNSLLCKTDHEKTCKSGMHTLFGCMWYLGKTGHSIDIQHFLPAMLKTSLAKTSVPDQVLQ